VASIASAPFGVQHWGGNINDAAGFRITDVGDTNGDGFDDYVIGAPSVAVLGNQVVPGNGPGLVYLVLGSRQVDQTAIADFLNLTSQQRIGDLALLGNLNQTNPTNGLAGFNYEGVRIQASQSPNGQLGSAVAGVGDVNNDGLADFMLGAPNGSDASGLVQGFGRAYLVYGSTNIASVTQFDLDTPSSNPSVRVLRFVTTQPTSRLGQAVAGVGNFLRDGSSGIAIGAPNASPTGIANSGAVYVVSGTFLRNPPTLTVDVTTVGQQGGVSGILLAGERAGQQAGLALAPAGDVNGDNGGAAGTTDDLLIGAPDQATWANPPGNATGPGTAYLVYGQPGLPAAQVVTNGVRNISLARVGSSAADSILGAAFDGTLTGERVGFAVSSAGDINGDNLSDFLIGAPGRLQEAGRATLIYGRPSGAQINGRFNINSLASPIRFAYFDGPAPGALAGYAVTSTGRINADTLNEFAIAAPGLNNNSGAVYLIPGNRGLTGGPFSLNTTTAQNSPVFALVITNSQPTQVPNFFGAGLGARQFPIVGGRYIDSDAIGDFVIGAPGYSPTGANQRQLAGAGFVIQGAFIDDLLPVPPPPVGDVTVEIGVGQAPPPPFSIAATTPDTLDIYVGSNNTVSPVFRPVTDIDPTTFTVNGVLFAGATVTADGDFNNDGITDAIVTISPRSALGLVPNSTVTFIVTGQTLGANPRQFSGSADVTILPNVIPPPPPILAAGPSAPPLQNFIPLYGEAVMPAAITMSRLNYRPLPVAVATQQFRPTQPWTDRLARFYGYDTRGPRKVLGSKFKHDPRDANTLGYKVFSRGKFPVGQVRFAPIKHPFRTIPVRRLGL
jgi:hypothetical protein